MARPKQLSLPLGRQHPALSIGGLFSGIGGLELGVEAAACAMDLRATTSWQVEINPYSRAVLAQHWPHARRFEDVTRVTADDLRAVSFMLAGSPCQDISLAAFRWGRKGLGGKRSGLWNEVTRLIEELGPDCVIWENVGGALCPLRDPKTKRVIGPAPLAVVLADLHDRGYDAYWTSLLAAAVGASHLRLRIFLVAWRRDGRTVVPTVGRACGHRLDLSPAIWTARPGDRPSRGEPERQILHSTDVPFHMERIEAGGNSVVPACAYAVGVAAVALRQWRLGELPALERIGRLREGGVDRKAVARDAVSQGEALADEALGLAAGITRVRVFGNLDDLDAAATACAVGPRQTPALCGSWPGYGVAIDGQLRAPDGAPVLDGAMACQVGDRCDGSDPVDAAQLRYWPTATARDWRSGKSSDATRGRNARPLSEVAAPDGFLNPDWVDRHMGFGAGWTELARPTLSQRKRGSKPY